MNGWGEVLNRLVVLLEKYVPSLLIAFGIGKRIGEGNKQETENELTKAQYELGKMKNEKAVRDSNSSDSDADVLRKAIERKRRT